MAIIVEEEKVKSNSSKVIGWVGVVGLLAVAGYYIFLAPPPPAIYQPPSGLTDVTALTQITFDPTSVVQDKTYESLKQFVPEPTSTGPGGVGRTNPFVSP